MMTPGPMKRRKIVKAKLPARASISAGGKYRLPRR